MFFNVKTSQWTCFDLCEYVLRICLCLPVLQSNLKFDSDYQQINLI